MNSPPPDTSQTKRPFLSRMRRGRNDGPAQDNKVQDEDKTQDEVTQKHHHLHVVSLVQCVSMYSVLILFYALVWGIVFITRRHDGFVSALPDLAIGETLSGTFNPHTAQKHLEAITTTPHPFNSRANTDITKKYLREQFWELQTTAVALGRRNVRFDDGTADNSTWVERTGLVVDGNEGKEDEELAREEMQVVQGDNMVMWVGGLVKSKEGPVEVAFEQENQTALLVSAHFDSVSTSYGATDDGGGVSVILALIRHFIHHPVEHTVIFILNNAEEDGMLGSTAFMGAAPNSATESGPGHPWKKYVKAFINLEGAGSGGPSIVFRASNSDIVRQYVNHAPFPHASVFANDAFKLKLIESETDYSIYAQHDIPGLDIAFYQRRSMYHSTTDYLPIQSLYHMGSNVQATIVGLCNSPYLDQVSAKTDAEKGRSSSSSSSSLPQNLEGKSIFYDFFGRYMVLTELWTAFLVNILVLGLGIPILGFVAVAVGQAIRKRQMRRHHVASDVAGPQNSSGGDSPTPSVIALSRISEHRITESPCHSSGVGSPKSSLMAEPDDGKTKSHDHQQDAIAHRNYYVPRPLAVLRTLGFVVLVVALDLVAVFAASKWQWFINPLARHSQQWLVLAFFNFLLVLVNTLAVWVFTLVESKWFDGPLPIGCGFSQWTIALGVWWWVVLLAVGCGVAGWAKAGMFYGTTVLSVCSAMAALIEIVLDFSVPTDGKGARFGWILVLAVSLLVPGVVISDLAVLVAHMTSQSLISSDGGLMYILYGLLTIPIMLSALPLISRSRNFKLTLLLELLVLIPLIVVLSKVDPFTSTSPASLYFSQYYNQTTSASDVYLQMGAGAGYLNRITQDVPTLLQYHGGSSNSGICTPFPVEGDLEEGCKFVPARQVFKDDGATPLRLNWTVKPELVGADGWRSGSFQILSSDSRSCSVHLPQTIPGHETQIWMEGTDIIPSQLGINHRPKTLSVYLRDWNRPWTVHVRVKDEQRPTSLGDQNSPFSVRFRVVCGYEDWSSGMGYASAFNEISSHLPSWGRMKGGGQQGLFSVGVDMVL